MPPPARSFLQELRVEIQDLVVLPGGSGALGVRHSKKADGDTSTDIAQGNEGGLHVEEDLVGDASVSGAGHEAVSTKGIAGDRAELGAVLKLVDEGRAHGALGDEVGVRAGEEKLSARQGIGLLTAGGHGGEATCIGEDGIDSGRALALGGNAAGARSDGLGKIEPELAAVGVDRFKVEWLHVGSDDQAVCCWEGGRCIGILS